MKAFNVPMLVTGGECQSLRSQPYAMLALQSSSAQRTAQPTLPTIAILTFHCRRPFRLMAVALETPVLPAIGSDEGFSS